MLKGDAAAGQCRRLAGGHTDELGRHSDPCIYHTVHDYNQTIDNLNHTSLMHLCYLQQGCWAMDGGGSGMAIGGT